MSMTTNRIPTELNWVEARASCTTARMFHELCEGCMVDVAVINSVRKLPPDESFQFSALEGGTTFVVGQLEREPRIVTRVGIVGDMIVVSDQPARGPDWFARVALNNEGRCILRLEDGTELEQWQFRKLALEDLLFGGRP